RSPRARSLFRSAASGLLAGTALSASREPCATRLHNRIPAHPSSSPALRVPALSSSPPASTPVSPVAADAHVSTSGNRPFFWIPESVAPGTHQTISSFQVANTALPALRTDIFRVPQTWYLSPLPCAAPRRESHRFW